GVTAALAAQIAQQTYAQQLAQVSAAVTQASAGLEQIDAQLAALDEQAAAAEEQREQSEELSDEQQAVADVRAEPLTVGDLADVEQVLAPSTVTQIDGIRAVTVSANPTASDLGELTQTVQTRLDALDVPAGITVEQGGASSDQQEAFTQLGLAMLLAIVLVFLIMVATFRSLVQPLILLVSIPFAATGAVAALLLTDTPLGVPAMVGLLMLIGIVVTNAIVLIDLVNQYRERGEDVQTAVVDGARLRLRPIIMTAAATICALVPMGLGLTGGGAFISRPLAIVVIGGLVSSTVLTLLLVPVLYTLVERRGERRRARREAPAEA
ncbi:MAG: RND multidrug efflux transporter; Acriflavin resistance protein, partial [uncultured Friedmanniella sp.]